MPYSREVGRGVAVMSQESSGGVRVVDTRGMVCPYPSFEAARAFMQASSGEVIQLITDNEESARSSIPQLLERRGVEFKLEEKQGYWVITFRKP